MLSRTKRKMCKCGCNEKLPKMVEPQVFSRFSCPPPPPPPCIPKTCGCFDKVNALDKKVDALKGDVTKNAQDIKDNYDYLSDVISELAYQHSKDVKETTIYINQIDSDNDAALQQEREQRISGDNNLQQQINNLTQVVNTNEDDIEDKLAAEIARATGEEARIENKLNNEIYRSTQEDIRIENKFDNSIASMNAHLEDILGIDAQGISEIKAILSDNDTTTGIIVELSKKALDSDLQAEKTRSLNKDAAHDTAIANLLSTKADKVAMTAGSYTKVTVNGQGIVTAGSNPSTIAGYGITDAYTKTEVDGKTSDLLNAIDAEVIRAGNAESALSSGKADKANITAGTYTLVTVNNQGIVTAGANPTTIAGYGITDAYTKTEIDGTINGINNTIADTSNNAPTLSWGGTSTIGKANGVSLTVTLPSNPNTNTTYAAGTGTTITGAANNINVVYGNTAGTACEGNDSRLSDARPASDVYNWAKASSKPSYDWSEITGKPSSMPASDVYSWAKASTKPSYSYSEISGTPTNVSLFTNDAGYLTSADIATLISDVNTLKSLWSLVGGYVTTTYPAKAAGFYDSTIS